MCPRKFCRKCAWARRAGTEWLGAKMTSLMLRKLWLDFPFLGTSNPICLQNWESFAHSEVGEWKESRMSSDGNSLDVVNSRNGPAVFPFQKSAPPWEETPGRRIETDQKRVSRDVEKRRSGYSGGKKKRQEIWNQANIFLNSRWKMRKGIYVQLEKLCGTILIPEVKEREMPIKMSRRKGLR